MEILTTRLGDFIAALSSKQPTPGGGGASALAGALAAALGAMVANLTTGKQKYAVFQEDIDRLLPQAAASAKRMLALIERDAEVFAPLAAAYAMPKDDPARGAVMEGALRTAVSAPTEILREAQAVVALLEELAVKGSRLALSDVGVAAAACRCAAEGAVMNVYINTDMMRDKAEAAALNAEAEALVNDCVTRCAGVYAEVLRALRPAN